MKVPLGFLEVCGLHILLVSRDKHRHACLGGSIAEIVVLLKLATGAFTAIGVLGREVDVIIMKEGG